MEQAKKSNKKLIIIIVAALVVLAAAFAIVFSVFSPKATSGAKAVVINVIDKEEKVSSYSAKTDAEFLAQVFEEIDGLTVEGSKSEYGLYIETVNGLTADYSVDQSYWAIYVNGEYGMYGADSQPVTDGDIYDLKYEVYTVAAE